MYCKISSNLQELQGEQKLQCEIRGKFRDSGQAADLLHAPAESCPVDVQLLGGSGHVHTAVQIRPQGGGQLCPSAGVPVPQYAYSRMKQTVSRELSGYGVQTVVQPVMLKLIIPEGLAGADAQTQSGRGFQGGALQKKDGRKIAADSRPADVLPDKNGEPGEKGFLIRKCKIDQPEDPVTQGNGAGVRPLLLQLTDQEWEGDLHLSVPLLLLIDFQDYDAVLVIRLPAVWRQSYLDQRSVRCLPGV